MKTRAVPYFHLDITRQLTNAAGAVVWSQQQAAFGEMVATGSVTMNVRIPGQYFNAESGLHYNYFRDYDPAVGRYIQSDPIGLEGVVNSYIYSSENPIVFIDPLGLQVMRPLNRLFPEGRRRPEPSTPDRDLSRYESHERRNRESWCAPYCDQFERPPPPPIFWKVCGDKNECPRPPDRSLPAADEGCWYECVQAGHSFLNGL